MPTVRGQFGQLLAPGLDEVMFEWLKEHPEEYSSFMKVGTSDAAYDEDQIIAGLGLARLKPEGEQITYDDPIQGGSKRYIHNSYALGWQATREMLDDERYDIMTQIPGELMKSCRQLWEQQGANTLVGGFSTTTVADGLALFHTAHPLLGGGTYQNRLSPDADISQTSIQDALVLFENMVNDRGLRMRVEPNDIWFNPNLQFVAGEVLQSQFKPGTGNNEINVVQGRLKPHVLHFVTALNQWYISNTTDVNFLKFKWRMRPTTDTIDDFETKGVKTSIYFRFSTGATDWRGWVGSNP
jgi:hypothetical protein